MNDNRSTINTPTWLTLLVVIMLIVRAFIGVIEHFYQREASGISWLSASNIDLSGRSRQPKLVLYSFTAKDNESCSKLDNTSFLSKDVVALVNEQFVAVQIQNIAVLDETVTSKLNSELQEKFAVFIYPTLVVTLPSGKIIESHSTYIGPKSLFAFLQHCMKKAKYVEGLDYLAHSKYYQASRAFEEWLRTMPNNSRESANGALYCALADKMLSNTEETRKVLGNLLKDNNDSADKNIANLLAHFLVGDLEMDELLKATAGDGNRDPRVYYFIAMLELKHRNIQSAVRYLNLADQGGYGSPEVHELVDFQLKALNSH